MLWAACRLGFFCFLRTGEIVAPGEREYDLAVHLTREDIAVDSWKNPTKLWVRLKQSKTDPFRKGILLHVGKTASDLCPVVAVMNYLLKKKRGHPSNNDEL